MKHARPDTTSQTPRIAFLLLLALAGGAIVALFPGSSYSLPTPESAQLSPEEQAYVDTIGVRVMAMSDELQAIAELVSTHSRNVLELNRRGTQVEKLAAEMQDFRERQPVPPRFVQLDQTVQDATAVALNAISEARDALRRFDFSGMADLLPSYLHAADAMSAAARDLEEAIGIGTPIASPEAP